MSGVDFTGSLCVVVTSCSREKISSVIVFPQERYNTKINAAIEARRVLSPLQWLSSGLCRFKRALEGDFD